jgi:predicted RNase H-like HicB family nuclease/predicted DNA-binding protein (UPF0251 family)
MGPKQKAIHHARFQFDVSGNWIASVEELPNVRTFGRTLGKARENLVDAMARWHGRHILDFQAESELHETVLLPPEVSEALDLAKGARELAEAVTREMNELTAAAALALVEDANLSVRDAASLIGVSHQRVHQIVSSVHAQRRAEEVRRSLAQIQEEMAKNPMSTPIGQLTSSQSVLLAALIIAGGAALVAASSKG